MERDIPNNNSEISSITSPSTTTMLNRNRNSASLQLSQDNYGSFLPDRGSLGPRKSILKKRDPLSSSMAGNSTRKDAFGYDIKTKGKNHRISFRQNIVDVKEVENWKKYNVDVGHSGEGSCCKIF